MFYVFILQHMLHDALIFSMKCIDLLVSVINSSIMKLNEERKLSLYYFNVLSKF